MSKYKVGKVFTSKTGGEFVITEMNGGNDITVMFIKTGYIASGIQTSSIGRGLVKDRLIPSVWDRGFVGNVPRKGCLSTSKVYMVWKSMFDRCYNPNIRSAHRYKGCEVAEEWWDFAVFKVWFEENYIKGAHLDKDALQGAGSKTYGPDTCLFVTQHINNILIFPNFKSEDLHYQIDLDFSAGKISTMVVSKLKESYPLLTPRS